MATGCSNLMALFKVDLIIRVLLVLALTVCLDFTGFQPVRAAPETGIQVKELNLVFLHGMGGEPSTFQLLSDRLEELLHVYTTRYQELNPGVYIRVNTMTRYYPGYTNIETWAKNMTDSINRNFSDKQNLILVGHSMGGKTALYAVAHNTGNISSRVAAVVTLNSPVKSLNGYYVPGGGPVLNYMQTTLRGLDAGISESVVYYDSSRDGLIVSQSKHWLAFVSAEKAPISPEFDRAGVDVWPRQMDDGVVPLSAQFSEGADVIYYGNYGHSDFAKSSEAAGLIANNILHYIFGDSIECSVLSRSGNLEHEADWLLGTDHFSDVVGGVVTSSGSIRHRNSAFYKWREFEDIAGESVSGDKRAYSYINSSSIPVLRNLEESRWLNSDNTDDYRLYLRSRIGPMVSEKIDWIIYSSGLLPEENSRAFYDVEITEGTPLADINNIYWLHEDPRDPVLWIWSEAQSPFRWFKAKWRIYQVETRRVRIIDEIGIKVMTPDQLI
jgi:pimeloyl-ACP methyl ester carboxylesterase